jgi:hypothetical protein
MACGLLGGMGELIILLYNKSDRQTRRKGTGVKKPGCGSGEQRKTISPRMNTVTTIDKPVKVPLHRRDAEALRKALLFTICLSSCLRVSAVDNDFFECITSR